ncbi:hypothetical protein [Allomuricauda sp. SCSIO 65647]|uniref:hypothetical protein n=1 Tax=Allomuricauda sp. SCSIO 65647 TaxID=2908843 RepID=UPI001F4881F1|nr:hypothetical protein [Muricauda sp. SCSIO 65647]UJH68630.1 hypothetical protein L0P89_05300 [Muricauda sp. SCSIO 65647]
MKRTGLFLLICFIGFQTIFAQDFFGKVSGNLWEGTGELLGSEATFRMEWEQILDGKFYQLSFQNQREESKEFIFKAIGVYKKNEDNLISGTWFDSRGFSFPLKGEVSSDKLIIFWGSPELEEGKTIYTIKNDSTISVEDYILKDGELIKFGNANYAPND